MLRLVQAVYGTVEGLSTFYYQPKQYCKQFHTHDTCDSPHSEGLHKPLFPPAWGNTWEAQNYIIYTQNSCCGIVYMCVCICVRVYFCVYRYVCVCVGLCNTLDFRTHSGFTLKAGWGFHRNAEFTKYGRQLLPHKEFGTL